VPRDRLARLLARERAEFTVRHPRSMQVHAQAGHLLGRVPMTWMSMWSGGFPVAFDSARGNRIVDVAGGSWLIDPAAHGGHREFDLAMMRLFGGFGPGAFDAYDEVAPLAPGWEERVPLHQLAPLVVHAIKFGGGYMGAATDAIARYA